MRDDEETKAELHQQVDDLKERLWTICDERKEKAEQERTDIMEASWVDDHLGILANHYITLMQAETDRYQDTARFLRDYYRAMEGHIPDELQGDYARIPLVEVRTAFTRAYVRNPLQTSRINTHRKTCNFRLTC